MSWLRFNLSACFAFFHSVMNEDDLDDSNFSPASSSSMINQPLNKAKRELSSQTLSEPKKSKFEPNEKNSSPIETQVRTVILYFL